MGRFGLLHCTLIVVFLLALMNPLRNYISRCLISVLLVVSLLLQVALAHACNSSAAQVNTAAVQTENHCHDNTDANSHQSGPGSHSNPSEHSDHPDSQCKHCNHGHCGKLPAIGLTTNTAAFNGPTVLVDSTHVALPNAPIALLEHPPKLA